MANEPPPKVPLAVKVPLPKGHKPSPTPRPPAAKKEQTSVLRPAGGTATPELTRDIVQNFLEQHPQVLVDALQATINKYHELLPIARQIEALVRLGVLAGLVPQHQVVRFLKRLREGEDEKRRLATYALGHFIVKPTAEKDTIRLPKRVFFESGSTIAYLIGALAQWIEENPGLPRPLVLPEVQTNNLLSLTAFVGLIDCVEHLRGRLYPKYLGFLPFEDDDPGDEDDDDEDEAKIVMEIVDGIRTCSAVFVTCSNFSFLAGPVVGSRANALMKRSIHYGKQVAEKKPTYCLMFHFSKIIPIHWPEGAEQPDIFDKPKLTCRRVFAAPQGLALPPQPEQQQWLREHSKREDSKREDSEQADIFVDGSTWHQHLVMPEKTIVSCPSEGLNERIKQQDYINHREYPLDLAGAWIDELSRDTHILIALPRNGADDPLPDGFNRAYDMLKSEINAATQIIRSSRHQKTAAGDKYEIATQLDQLEHTDGVVEILVH
jgi:hypothetical protein